MFQDDTRENNDIIKNKIEKSLNVKKHVDFSIDRRMENEYYDVWHQKRGKTFLKNR